MAISLEEVQKSVGPYYVYSGCPRISIEIQGNCPVQANGKIGKDKFYFRARHENWQFEVYDKEDTNKIVFSCEGEYETAGWMYIKDVFGFIGEQLQEYWTKKDNSGGAYRRIFDTWGKEVLDEYKKKIKTQEQEKENE